MITQQLVFTLITHTHSHTIKRRGRGSKHPPYFRGKQLRKAQSFRVSKSRTRAGSNNRT